jgi:phosphomethylpyrimidine synthase
MKITQEVREYAAAQGLAEREALQAGMAEKAQEFQDGTGEVYAAPSK